MNFGRMLKNLEKLTVDNTPAILTAVGVAGAITTAVLSGRSAVETYVILEDAKPGPDQMDYGLGIDRKEKAKLVWQVWVLPVSVGAITCTSIVMANRIGTRRAAAMATAYVISEKAFEEYREKVVEKLGVNKERAARDEIAQNRVSKMDDSDIFLDEGEVLCCDQFTGRYFKSTMENIKKAQNDTNYQIMHSGNQSLSEFYGRLGLEPTSMSDGLGWNSDNLMDILFSTTMSPNGKPCISIDFRVTPIRNFHRFL